VYRYIDRHIPEYNKLKEERERRGRPQTPRERLIKDLREKELQEFLKSGFG
jgi:hypothetical protein